MAKPRKSSVEIEIKLAFSSAVVAKRALRAAGFRVTTRRGHEANTLYDTATGALRKQGIAIRHRQWHGDHIITYKGPIERVAGNLHKQRLELETAVADPAPILATWKAASLVPTFRYEKYRTVFTRPGERGHVMLDETPLGTYLELEGTPSWIDRVARLLGRGPSDYIQTSYPALQAQACQRKGIVFRDLLFDSRYKET